MVRYAISNGAYQAGDAARWAGQQVDFVQLREKTLGAGELTGLVRQILAELAGSSVKLLVNGRADVAVAAGAHGVHLTSQPGELTPEQVRAIYQRATSAQGAVSAQRATGAQGATSSQGPTIATPPCVSVSCHTLDEVARAQAGGADLILFGPVFEKRVARQLIADGSGLRLLSAAVRAARETPVLALGGITAENTADCLAAGAAGIAAIRLFSSSATA